jgi:membrane-associated phospholipid phosphatase
VRPRPLKLLFAAWPAWVAFALVATGNHFLLDIAAGLVLAVVGPRRCANPLAALREAGLRV